MIPMEYYNTDEQRARLMSRLHTVETMMQECRRSRSWAYQMIASYPGERRIICDTRTGKKEQTVPRIYVQRYLERVRRGNPYW